MCRERRGTVHSILLILLLYPVHPGRQVAGVLSPTSITSGRPSRLRDSSKYKHLVTLESCFDGWELDCTILEQVQVNERLVFGKIVVDSLRAGH